MGTLLTMVKIITSIVLMIVPICVISIPNALDSMPKKDVARIGGLERFRQPHMEATLAT